MAIITGYSLYSCDRCGDEEFATSTPTIGYHEIKRYDAEQELNTYGLCTTCYTAWSTLEDGADDDFDNFMENK